VAYLIFVCLVSAYMAWHTWHSNPLYSARSTMRFTRIVFLTIGAVIAAIVATVNLTKNYPESIALAATLCVGAISTLALIYAVMIATSPPPPALPPGVELLTTMRSKMMSPMVYTAMIVVATALFALVLPADYNQLALFLGGLISFICIVLVFTRYVQSLIYDRGLTAIELHPWVRWTYSPDDWKRHTDAQALAVQNAAQASGSTGRWRIVILACLAALAIGFWLSGGGTMNTLVTVALLAVLGATFAVTAIGHTHAPHRRRAFLITTKNEACFGEPGLFIEGNFAPWNSGGCDLISATIDEMPPRSLALTFLQMTLRPSYYIYQGFGHAGALTALDRVLLPNSPPAILAADLERLGRGLAVVCPEASIELGPSPPCKNSVIMSPANSLEMSPAGEDERCGCTVARGDLAPGSSVF
jgi:hypothetical protein